MAAIASYIRNNERFYNICLYIFLIFLVTCQVAIFLSVMKIVKLEYGDGLRRKIFVQKDDMQKAFNHVVDEMIAELHFNDGTYLFDKDG